MSVPTWPSVKVETEYGEKSGKYITRMTTQTKLGRELSATGESRTESGSVNSARRALRKLVDAHYRQLP